MHTNTVYCYQDIDCYHLKVQTNGGIKREGVCRVMQRLCAVCKGSRLLRGRKTCPILAALKKNEALKFIDSRLHVQEGMPLGIGNFEKLSKILRQKRLTNF